MLDDRPLAVLPDHGVGFRRETAVLHVQLLQGRAPIGDQHQAFVCDCVTRLDAQLAQTRAVDGERVQAFVRDVTLADVQGLEARAVAGDELDAAVRHALAAADVQVA